MRLAIATCAEHARYHPDDLPLVEALAARGLHPEPCLWNAPGVPWAAYDAVLVRTIWDYYRRYADYRAWLTRLEQAGVPVLNPIPLLRWNADKRYLHELARDGVAVLPSRVVESGTLAAAMDAAGWDDVVAKPVVSAGAFHTLRVRRDEVARHEPAFAEALAHAPMLVQPYASGIELGEWSLLFFGGEYSHAVLKQPRRGDFRVQEKHGGTLAPAPADAAMVAQARAMLQPVVDRFGMPTYARVDAVLVEGSLQLMELELIEPQLFLAGAPGAGMRMAHAVEHALRHLR